LKLFSALLQLSSGRLDTLSGTGDVLEEGLSSFPCPAHPFGEDIGNTVEEPPCVFLPFPQGRAAEEE
jgi:hypothetical protein